MGKNHPNVDPYVVSRVRALESLLLEKGILAPDAVDRVVQRYEADTGPMVGARAVARAWTDPAYRARCCSKTPTAALADFGLGYDRCSRGREHAGRPQPRRLHALLLLSRGRCWACRRPGTRCRPTAPARSASRARCCAEFGLDVPPEREMRVWDSSAEMRYMVLPSRPPGTEGLGEAELVPLITRDALIGVAEPWGARRRAADGAVYERRRNIVVRPDGRPVNVARFRGQLFVCATGCCCGRTEDGFAAVPAETFHREWERRRLRNVVHLTIGGCLGPCALANVALLLFDGQAQWFHSVELRRAARSRIYDHVEAHAGRRRLPAAAARARAVSVHGVAPGSRGPTASRSTTIGPGARRAGRARLRDAVGRWPPTGPALSVDRVVAAMEGQAALPRKNGELVFDEPWQGRVFGMAVALHEQGLYDWEEFRQALIAQIAGRGSAPRPVRATTRSGSPPSRACSPRKGLVTRERARGDDIPVRVRRARRRVLTRGGAQPPFRTSPQRQEARAKPALGAAMVGC